MTKNIVSSLILILASTAMYCQRVDTLKLYAQQYPREFLRFVSAFYEFNEDERQRYKDEDFYIDSGPKPNWSDEMIIEYLGKDYCGSGNTNIKWNETLITAIKDNECFTFDDYFFDRKLTISNAFLDKYPELRTPYNQQYIIAHTQDSTTFYQKWRNTDIKQNRLIDYGEMIAWEAGDQSNENNRLLIFRDSINYREYLFQNINITPINILKNLMPYLSKSRIEEFAQWNLSWKKYFELCIFFNSTFHLNQSVYNSLFKDKLTPTYFREIIDLINTKEYYYKIPFLNEDKYGYKPSIIFPDSIYQNAFKIIKPGLIMQLEASPNGLDRFSDIYETPYIHFLIINAKVNKVFKKFNILSNEIIPIKLTYDSHWYGRDTMDYFIYRFENYDKSSKFIPSGTILNRRIDSDSMTVEKYINKDIIDDPDTIDRYFKSQDKYSEFGPMEYIASTLIDKPDLMFDGVGFLITKELIDAANELNIDGIKGYKTYDTYFKFRNNPKIDNQKRLDLLKKTVGTKSTVDSQKSILKYQNYKGQTNIFRKLKTDVLQILGKKNFTDFKDSLSFMLYQFQVNNNILIPEKFSEFFLTNHPKIIYTPDAKNKKWDGLPLNQIYTISPEDSKWNPHLFRAVVIAQNSSDRKLILMRKKGSAYELSGNVFALWQMDAENINVSSIKIVK